jgi:hypothetical protein
MLQIPTENTQIYLSFQPQHTILNLKIYKINDLYIIRAGIEYIHPIYPMNSFQKMRRFRSSSASTATSPLSGRISREKGERDLVKLSPTTEGNQAHSRSACPVIVVRTSFTRSLSPLIRGQSGAQP